MSSSPRLVFASGMEGLFSKSLVARLTPDFKAELKQLGVDLSRPFLPAYPVETWKLIVEALSKHLYAELSMEEAHLQLGHDTVQGFGQTFIGTAMFGLLRLIGPARAVERATRNYASTNNYTKVTLTRLSPTSFDFHLNEQHTLPQYDMGVLEAMLDYLGAKDRKVTLVTRDAEGFTMHLTWSA